MKAKVKETDEIVDVTPNPTWYTEVGQGPDRREWDEDDLDFIYTSISDRNDEYISLNKACEWLKSNTYSIFVKSCSLFDAIEEFTENFKQAMKGDEE